MFATRNLSVNVTAVNRRPREDAYGLSPIDSSTHNTEQIDLWMNLAPIEAPLARYETK
jgi:hypothetical protein